MFGLRSFRKQAPTIDGDTGGAFVALPGSPNNGRGRNASGGGNFYEALAEAWGRVLDKKADELVTASQGVGNGANSPSDLVRLSALSQEFGFVSTSASTSHTSVAEGLGTLARKGG